ncbi:BatA domain-containing protein [Stieleria sp. TO1_6]|uniref:BatA domain-containing protein n=1 Tax=Stieleria tagensis TaxID=2956795 RepID=UPI00209B9296|nr:BatA domain-containing protein [Stieleria tagensis]MCO8124089.1 BatA domain-containing protein [Stieleria tagensis]
MTFLNATLLLALTAIGIPIVMHLIARKEPKQVLFPSVRLLTQRFETNRSKLRVRRWWLLALRIAAMAALALALARPVISQALSLTWSTIGIVALAAIATLVMASVAAGKPNQTKLMWSLLATSAVAGLIAILWGGYTAASGTKPQIDRATPVALAIVIDNSSLLGWNEGSSDHLTRTRSAAEQLLVAASPESRLAIIDRSATPATFALDLAGALSKVEQLQPLEVVQPLESRLEAAARLLQSSEIPSRQLVLISALPASSFNDQPSGNSLAGLIDELGIRVTLWDIGGFAGVNRSLSVPQLSDRAPAPETPVVVATTLSINQDESTTDQPETDQTVEVTAECVLYPSDAALPVVRDGTILLPAAKPVDRVSVPVSPGRNVELQMTLPPLPVGLHHGAIHLTGSDALSIDDSGYFTVTVLPPSRLLLVGDRTAEVDEIGWSISAPIPVNDPAAQYAIEQVSYQDLAATTMTNFAGVILLDPPENSLGTPELQRYIAAGGSVFLAVGDALGADQVQVNGYPTFSRRWRVPDPGTFLEISAASHPALNALAQTPGGVPFQDARVYQYWQVDPGDDGQTLMRYAGMDHAALLEIQATANVPGKLLILTTPIPDLVAGESWNELFRSGSWTAFALIRELTQYLTGRSSESWSMPVGTAVSIPIQSLTATDDQPRRLQWFPAQGTAPVPIDLATESGDETQPRQRILIGQPQHSGVHWIRGDEPGLGFTINLPRAQLATKRVEPSQLSALLGDEAVKRIESLDEMEWTAGRSQPSVPLWSPIMLLALVIFLLEQILANRFYRRPNTGPSITAATRSAA